MRAVLLVLVVACGRPDERELAGSLTVDVEEELDTATIVPAPERQDPIDLIATPTGYLALWLDSRDDFGTDVHTARAFFTRIAADGTVEPGVPLSDSFDQFRPLAVACDDAVSCLFVGNTATNTIVGVRTSGTQVLDPIPVTLATGTTAAVAWDGNAFRLVWSDGSTVGAASVALDGTVGVPFVVGSGRLGGIGCERPRCLVTYRNAAAVGRLIGATAVAGNEFTIHTAEWHDGRPFWDGTCYWVAMVSSGVRVARMTADGSVLDPAGIPLGSVTAGSKDVRVGHDGTHAIVMWNRKDQLLFDHLRVARVTDLGVVLDPEGVEIVNGPTLNTNERTLGLACSIGRCLAAWPTFFLQDMLGTRLAGTTTLDTHNLVIASSPAGQVDAWVTFGLGHYLAVWRDSRKNPSNSIRYSQFSQTAAPVSRAMPGLTNAPRDRAVAVASTTSYFVAYRMLDPANSEPRDFVRGNVLDAAGEPIDTGTSAIFIDDPPIAGRPASVTVGSDGATFLVAWDVPAAPMAVQARWYDANGGPLANAFTIVPDGYAPVLGFDGTSYLLAWQREVAGTVIDIHVSRRSANGLQSLGEFALATTGAREDAHAVACTVGTCAIAWRAGQQMLLARITGTTILDPGGIVIGTASGATRATSIAFDGSAFVVVWQTQGELRTAKVALDGTVLEANTLFATPTTPSNPSIASDGAGHVVVSYDRLDTSPAFRVRRVRARASTAFPAPPDAGVPDAAPVVDAPSDDAAPAIDDAAPAPPDAASAHGGDGGCASSRGVGGLFALLVGLGLCTRKRLEQSRSIPARRAAGATLRRCSRLRTTTSSCRPS